MEDRVRFGSILGNYLFKFAAESKTPIPEKASSSISYDLSVILGQYHARTREDEALELLSQNYEKVQQYVNVRVRFNETIIDLANKFVIAPTIYSEAKQKVDNFINEEELPIEVKTVISESLISLERKLDPRQSRKTRSRVEELQNEIKVLQKLMTQIKPKVP